MESVLGLTKFADHKWQILASALVWQLVVILSRRISPSLPGGRYYAQLHANKQLQWDIRIVALVHAFVISSLSLWLLVTDQHLKRNPLFGYSQRAGAVYSVAIGFFAWDCCICVAHLQEYGWQFLVHAVACLSVYLFSMTPFAMYYGAVFLLFELSTPLLNMNWFLHKCDMAGTAWHQLNGVVFAAVFLVVRICFGLY